MSENKLFDEIQQGKKLKHVEKTNDKSGPVIEKDVKVKESKKGELLEEIKGDKKLNHVETKDKSGPVIEKDVKVKENKRGDLLAQIKKENN